MMKKKIEQALVTGYGWLLFGKNPRLRFKQHGLMASVDYGNGKIEPKKFEQALVLIPDLVDEWLNKVLLFSKDTSSFKRKDIADFPIEVLREAVINALVHRDYSIEGAKCHLEIDKDKIVIKSPGAPLPSISLEQLNTFNAPSISRNPMITYVFGKMDYVEEKGYGMKALKSLNEKYGLPLPEYTYEDPFLILTFPRNIESVKKVTHIQGLKNLNKEELEGYEFIKLNNNIKRIVYEKHFDYDKKKAERHFKKFVDLKLVKKIGSGPKTAYEIIAT